MKKVLISLAITIFSATAISAQGRPQMNPEEIAKRETDRIKEYVKLNEDQYKRVLEVNTQSMKNIVKSMQERREDRSQVVKYSQQRDSTIKSILTPDQVALYDKYLKERRDMRNGSRPGGPR